MQASRTSVNHVVLMTIFKGTSDLTSELARDTLAKAAVTDNVVEHLPTVDVLEHHVIVVLMDYHFSHTAYVRMIEELRESSFTKGTNLFGSILLSLLCDRICVWGTGGYVCGDDTG